MSLLPRSVRAVLLDVEGTTTPLSFVTQVLFPYARAHLRSYLEQHATAEEQTSLIDRLKAEHDSAIRRGDNPPPWTAGAPADRIAAAAEFAEWLMDRDSKCTPLKDLQGWIWEDGYRNGALTGQVFSDVAPALARWRAQGISVSIYSSGSVLAQQLLFRHTSDGDLTPLLHSYFDTRVGIKGDASSYHSIAKQLQLPATAVLFLSDVPRELDAAQEAGMDTGLVMRPGNAPVPDHPGYLRIQSFEEL